METHLRGTRFFMDMVKDPDYVKSLIEYCARYAIKMAQLYMDAGMDIIAVVDPIVSQVSPKHFEALVSDSYKALFDYIRSQGRFSSFFVCGNATLQLEVMCHTMPDSIAVDENVDLVAGKAVTDKYNITISGNIPLTTVMLHGTQQDNMKLVVDLLDKMDSTTNLIVSPGCDMPYDVPIENTIACAQAALNTDMAREIIKNYVAVDDDIEVVLPDYENLEKPLVEVFTLDSVQCAACTYMMAAANEAKAIYGDKIDVVEYKYIYKENIARTKKMALTNLPTMCVNGEIKFVSLIPTIQELSAAIDAKL